MHVAVGNRCIFYWSGRYLPQSFQMLSNEPKTTPSKQALAPSD